MSEENTLSFKNEKCNEVRILSTGKAVVFGLPNLGLTAVLGIMVSFTLIFYINILGQPPMIAGGIYSAALYLYALMCIFGGALSDKVGKKKVMAIAGPIITISFILIWIPPVPTTEFGVAFPPLIITFAFWSFVFRIMVGWFQPTLYSFLPELSTEEQNRVKVSMINMLMMIGGTVIGAMVPIIMMGDATEGLSRDDPKLFLPESSVGEKIFYQTQIFATMVGILFLILFIIMMIIIKEPEKNCEEKASLKEILRGALEPIKDPNYRLFLITFFLFWIPFVSFQYLILSLGTFLLQLRGNEFIILAGVALVAAIISFVIWSKFSERYGLKKSLTICLLFAGISFFLILILLIPMNHDLIFGIGILLISLCLCALVGTMVFPFAIISDIIDQAEARTGKLSSGSYSGAFTMMGSLASGTAMLIISAFLEVFGPEHPISYAFILSLGAAFILVAVVLFQKVKIVGQTAQS
ncbi:MAG: MFS transporter [Promethearchaeota archaeon]